MARSTFIDDSANRLKCHFGSIARNARDQANARIRSSHTNSCVRYSVEFFPKKWSVLVRWIPLPVAALGFRTGRNFRFSISRWNLEQWRPVGPASVKSIALLAFWQSPKSMRTSIAREVEGKGKEPSFLAPLSASAMRMSVRNRGRNLLRTGLISMEVHLPYSDRGDRRSGVEIGFSRPQPKTSSSQ